jgi:hypothetical protein
LPNIDADELSDSQELLFYQMMMILFKPFRNLTDLVSACDLEAWKTAYNIWSSPRLSILAQRYLENNLDYYDSSKSTDEESDLAKLYFESLPEESTSCNEFAFSEH